MAVYRARETERPDAHFRDPFAAALAGARGLEISRATSTSDRAWFFTTRTVLFDRIIAAEIARGVDLVINLAAGVDTRPYRMDLPASLQWVEIDLPSVFEYKTPILAAAQPRCRLERIPLDLADLEARRRVFTNLAARSTRALIVSEGLVVYLSEAEVGLLATDLAAVHSFERWALEFPSPALLQMMTAHTVGQVVRDAGAPFRFGPASGADFFRPYGWQPIAVESMLKAALQLGRLPERLRMYATGPQSEDAQQRPATAVCLFERQLAAEINPGSGVRDPGSD
jgi:methyltransferase (TIGR00027 family)